MELEGLVFRSTGSWYVVEDEQGATWNTRLKGKMKIDDAISSTNPIAVGDKVIFDIEDEAVKVGIIKKVKDRNNYIVRVSPHNKNQKHIIAANLTLAVLVVTINEPRTSTGFIDRFLITAEAYHVPSIIVVNKTDLLKPKHVEILKVWERIYAEAGYEVYPIVAKDKLTLQRLADRINGGTALFSGHSGVGKSTLINQLIPGVQLKTLEVSGWSGKGQHTTTFAEMYHLPNSQGNIIDTPGVKEFGIIDFDKQELAHYFPELRKRMTHCKFNNCLHVNEPGCAVIEAFENGQLAEERYFSYRAILDSIEDKW